MRDRLIEFVPGLLGGVLGGVAGFFLVQYLTRFGFWAPIVMGAFAGLGCGQLSPVWSRRRGVLNALGTLGLVIYAQFLLFDPPFPFDGTIRDYVLHLPQLPPWTLGFMVINVLLAFWWGREQGIGFTRRPPKFVSSPRDRPDAD